MTDVSAASLPAAPLKNRLFCMVYEGMLLFGVLFISGWLFSTLLQQRHALVLRHAQQGWQFLVLGAYFVWFWTHSGQTLAMKTWQIQLRRADGGRVGALQAGLRYLLSWLWFVPALLAAHHNGWTGRGALALSLLGGVAAYAALSLLLPGRQFLHDRLCRTELVRLVPPPKPAPARG